MSSDLRPYGGSAQRAKPIFEVGPIGPWKAYVKVTPITGLSTRDWFEVGASWHGPGMPDLPPTDGPVDASDCYWLPDNELAVKVAKAAAESFRVPKMPELRELAQALS